MAKFKEVLHKELWSEQTDDRLNAIGGAAFALLIAALAFFWVSTSRNPTLLFAVSYLTWGIGMVVASAGIWRRELWGYRLAFWLAVASLIFHFSIGDKTVVERFASAIVPGLAVWATWSGAYGRTDEDDEEVEEDEEDTDLELPVVMPDKLPNPIEVERSKRHVFLGRPW